MTIYIGADHGGFSFKASITEALKKDGYDVVDVGAFAYDPADDYPDFARVVAEKVAAAVATPAAPGSAATQACGIVICRSGFGVDIVANKFAGVRSGLAMSPEHIRVGRHDDGVNVLSIAADFTSLENALEIAHVFLATSFESGEPRYVRRVEKIAKIERAEK
jgi:ribose 5-phosphate isomerase B